MKQNLISTILRTILLCLCLCLVNINLVYSVVDYTPNEDESLLFECSSTETNWVKNDSYATPLITKQDFAGSYWKTTAFIMKKVNSIDTGIGAPYTAELFSISAIENPIATFVVNVEADKGQIDKLIEIYLEISDNPNFNNPQKYEASQTITPEDIRGDVVFQIDNPKQHLYYKLCFKYNACSNANQDWLHVFLFKAYTPNILAPNLSGNNQSESYVTLRSDFGELHVLLDEYDIDGNFVREVIPVNQSQYIKSNKVVALDDTTWRNKVADEGEDFVINRPTTENTYYQLRAKSVYTPDGATDEIQSPELVETIRKQSIVTLTPNIVDNNDCSQTAWYNLQGMRVENPVNGIFLRVENGNVTKVCR